jgi:hypothetical protein
MDIKNDVSSMAGWTGLAPCPNGRDVEEPAVEQAVRAIEAAKMRLTMVLSFIAVDFM